jgi:hypothetical protein
MALASLLLSAVLLTASPRAAGADLGPAAAPAAAATEPPRQRWYGWQLLLSDIVFIGVIADAKDTKVTESAIGFAGLSLGAPILHFANGNPRVGFTSLLLRTLASGITFAAVRVVSEPVPSDRTSSDYGNTLVVGLLGIAATLGGLTYILIDDCALARVPVRTSGDSAPGAGHASRGRELSVVPTLFAGPRAGGVGLVALF